MTKYRKKAVNAMRAGKEVPQKPPAIIMPRQHLPQAEGDPRKRIQEQTAGTTEGYLLDEPCYVHFVKKEARRMAFPNHGAVVFAPLHLR